MRHKSAALQSTLNHQKEKKRAEQAASQHEVDRRPFLHSINHNRKFESRYYHNIDDSHGKSIVKVNCVDGHQVREEIYQRFARIIAEEYREEDPRLISQAVSAAEKAIQRILSETQTDDERSSDSKQTPVKLVPLMPSELDEALLDGFYRRVIARLAPSSKTLPAGKRNKLEEKAVAILSGLNGERLDEIQCFMEIQKSDDELNVDSLSSLSLKSRAVVLSLHYLERQDWRQVRSKKPTPDEWLHWLDLNFSDRRRLGLVQGDLQYLDPAAYQKLMAWTQPNAQGKYIDLPDFDLPTKNTIEQPAKSKNAPSGAQIFDTIRKTDPRASALKRLAERNRYQRSPSSLD